MRNKAITFRVEEYTSRALTWLVNNYNLDNYSAATKTDLLEGLITLALEDSDILQKAMKRGIKNDSSTKRETKA